MNPMRIFFFCILCFPLAAQDASDADIDLPPLGKWMLTKEKRPADWLGVKVDSKTLYEPINVVLLDPFSQTEQESIQNLEKACELAGYKKEWGHSTGYHAEIGGEEFDQLPREWRMAFADGTVWQTCNHGRLFGPYKTAAGYLYVGAFSREAFVWLSPVHHSYVSFQQARDDFCLRLTGANLYQNISSVPLGNQVDDDPEISTGDHDGFAVLLRRIPP